MAGYSYGLYNNFETEKRLLSAECAARITLKSHNSCSRELNENNLKGEMHDE